MTSMTNTKFILTNFFLIINGIYSHPIPDETNSIENLMPLNIETVIVASAIFICIITVLIGCLCCHGRVFKRKDTIAVFDSVHNGPIHEGYVNANLGTEFTIFPPRANVGHRGSLNDVKFEPLPDIRPRGRSSSGSQRPRPATFCTVINRGLPVQDWFDDPSSNFPRNQLQYLQELGSGWFGQIVEGEAQGINRNCKKTKVVVKILREDATPTDQIYFLHEVRAFRDLDHPNVMQLLGKCLETDPFLIILEHCAFKDLKTYLIQHRTESESLIQGNILLRMMCNVAAGLNHMHKNNFVHIDLAARNCLVTNDLQVKIGDYGNSIEKFKDDYYCATDLAVPIRWCAPESLRCTETTIEPKEVSPEANIWSFGVIVWEILEFAKLPYNQLHEEDVLQKVIIEKSFTLIQPLTASAHKDKIYQVMQLCWLTDPKLRPNMEKIESLLTHLYTYCDASKTPMMDFEARWNTLQPRSNARLVNVCRQVAAAGDASTRFENDFTQTAPSSPHASNLSFDFASSPASNLSPSLQNLRGSLDDLSDSNLNLIKPTHHVSARMVQREFDEWLVSQQSKGGEDYKMARQISEAMVTLDLALAEENVSSSESNHTSPERELNGTASTDSIEPVTKLVKEKSASVQDFFKLTIIESDNSDSGEGASANVTLVAVDKQASPTKDFNLYSCSAYLTPSNTNTVNRMIDDDDDDDDSTIFRWNLRDEGITSTPLGRPVVDETDGTDGTDEWQSARTSTYIGTFETAIDNEINESAVDGGSNNSNKKIDVINSCDRLSSLGCVQCHDEIALLIEELIDKVEEQIDFGDGLMTSEDQMICEAVNDFVMIAINAQIDDDDDLESASTLYEVEDIEEALMDLDVDNESDDDKFGHLTLVSNSSHLNDEESDQFFSDDSKLELVIQNHILPDQEKLFFAADETEIATIDINKLFSDENMFNIKLEDDQLSCSFTDIDGKKTDETKSEDGSTQLELSDALRWNNQYQSESDKDSANDTLMSSDSSTTHELSHESPLVSDSPLIDILPDDDLDDEVLMVDTETHQILMIQNEKIPQMTYTYQEFSEMAPTTGWDDEWKQMTSLKEPVAGTSSEETSKCTFMWPGSSDSEEEILHVGDDSLESVGDVIPRPMAPEPNYTPDWESESEESSASSSSSSTSGEFDCSKNSEIGQAKAMSDSIVDNVIMEVNGENGETEEMAIPEIRVSTWDKDATPKKSALKNSPEKLATEKKSVKFAMAKKQFVYEYPKEKEWKEPSPSRSTWTFASFQQPYHINYADWEMSDEDIAEDIVEVEELDENACAASSNVFRLDDELLYRLSDVPVDELESEDTDQIAFVDPLVGPITYRELFEHYRTNSFYPPPYDESQEMQENNSWPPSLQETTDDFLTTSFGDQTNQTEEATGFKLDNDHEHLRLVDLDEKKSIQDPKENGNLIEVFNNNNSAITTSPERHQKNVSNQELLI